MHSATSILAFVWAGSAIADINARNPYARLHLERRDITSYTTTEYVATFTSTGYFSHKIDAEIDATGVSTFIPGALTMTFSRVPAYFYLETQTTGTKVISSMVTSKIPITSLPSAGNISPSQTSIMSTTPTGKLSTSSTRTASTNPNPSTSSLKSTSTNKVITGSKSSTSTTKTAATDTSSAAQNSATCCLKNSYPVPQDSRCTGQPDGAFCGSAHECYQGGCFWFDTDQYCGSYENACNTNAGWYCAGGTCVNAQNDVNNCGKAYYKCGDDYGNSYACSKGTCINISSDNNNCGSLGHVCAQGTGCKSGTCIDTTSDNENCSTVGYACPKGTFCKASWCQPAQTTSSKKY